jgi:DNA-binding NtrC family response regulator
MVLQLEITGRFDKILSQVHREDVRLVLLHLSPECDAAQLIHLIRASERYRRTIAFVALSDEHVNDEARELLRDHQTPLLVLPNDLRGLTRLMEQVTRTQVAGEPVDDDESLASLTTGGVPFFHVVEPEMQDQMGQIRRIAPLDTTIMLTGETGTGKTLLASYIHKQSPRRNQPFLVMDCGTLSPTLIESELFGHVKGAFSGADRDHTGKLAAAGRGTLVLDEIDSLPAVLQSKLLRAVEERVFEPVGSNKSQPLQARLIVLSNAALEQAVKEGRFRADLFYRLNVVRFHMRPLRKRRSAIEPLVQSFLTEYANRYGRDLVGIAPDALRALIEYHWPGNIRELRNVIERAVVLCPEAIIRMSDLPDEVRGSNSLPPLDSPCSASVFPEAPFAETIDKSKGEIRRIQDALRKHHNNRLRAAAELGISRMSFYKKLHKYGLFERNGMSQLSSSS